MNRPVKVVRDQRGRLFVLETLEANGHDIGKFRDGIPAWLVCWLMLIDYERDELASGFRRMVWRAGSGL